MTETKRISIIPKRTFIGGVIRHAVFWAILIGAVGVSKYLFGGSWVIDILVLTITICVVIGLATKLSGSSADMTKEQIAAWVAAGQPADVKAWKDRTYGV